MPLYAFNVSFSLVVQADDDWEAESNAKYSLRDAISDCQPDVECLGVISNMSDLPDSWDGKCLPYYGDGQSTIEKILEK